MSAQVARSIHQHGATRQNKGHIDRNLSVSRMHTQIGISIVTHLEENTDGFSLSCMSCTGFNSRDLVGEFPHSKIFFCSQPSSVFTHSSPGERQSFDKNGIAATYPLEIGETTDQTPISLLRSKLGHATQVHHRTAQLVF